MNDPAYNEAPLVGMLPKTQSAMTDEELRAFVEDVRNTRSTIQTLAARMAVKRAIKTEAAESKKVENLFGDF